MRFILSYFTATIIAGRALVSAENVIVPGAAWTDTSGNVIQGHSAGILKVGSTFYWFGEDKAANSALFSAVSCYTSSDLVNWSRQSDALTPTAGTMISASDIVERPKVLFNEKNQEYVMWFHSDTSNYGAAMVGVATAETPCGPYTYKTSWQPLGADSRDMGLFQDSELSAYLLYASDNNQDFKIASLDSDYYNVTAVVSQLNGATLEAPGIVKRDSTYYLFASHTSGWDPNPNKFFSSSSLSGNWSSQEDIAPENTRTYFSQNAFDLPLGSNASAIYMGDRWRPSLLGSSSYIWYPLDWSSGSPQIVQADVWSVDVSAGTYSVASGTSYEAESGTLSGNATVISGSSFSGGKVVGYLGNGGSVTINDVQGNGQGQWVALYYANADSFWRNTTVSVNGGATVLVDQPNTGGVDDLLSVPVKLNLTSGANSLTFSSNQSSYAGDLDKFIVYQQG
ncbi:Arabinanase/levansucrase/invertase [Phellopilus nigrolimitatus]|nr:Arabinanase/levansucrase/invertase [Phellopilus nigrolimitatus]